MGLFGKKKKSVIGHKYYLGMHALLCQGRIDFINKIFFADKVAWAGRKQVGSINIDKQNLFGGIYQEGGIAGTFNIHNGSHDQDRDSYLIRKLDRFIPAYRHVASVVMHGGDKGFYIGNTPYPKEVSCVVQRINYQDSENEQWYKEKAAIFTGDGKKIAFAFVLDFSLSPSEQQMKNMISALDYSFERIKEIITNTKTRVDVFVGLYNGNSKPFNLKKENITIDTLNYFLALVKLQYRISGDNLPLIMDLVADFFDNTLNKKYHRICIFMSDDEISNIHSNGSERVKQMIARTGKFSDINSVDIYCGSLSNKIGNLSHIDNTPEDTIPVSIGLNDMQNIFTVAYGKIGNDMNPAHILRELVLNENWGMNSGGVKNEINEENFKEVADRLYSESFGLSYYWTSQGKIEELKSNIEETVDCVLYQNATTNKFEIKLFREDYKLSDLKVFDESNIVDVGEISKNIITEMINSVTINFIDRENDYVQGSVTVRDDALINLVGGENNTTISYDMVYSRALATRLALRILGVLSSDLASTQITVNTEGRKLSVGDVFLLNLPYYEMNNTPMRVKSIDNGTYTSNKVVINCTVDVFNLSNIGLIGDQPSITIPPDSLQSINKTLLIETPYYLIVQSVGQSIADFSLENMDVCNISSVVSGVSSDVMNIELLTSKDNEKFDYDSDVDICESRKLIESITQLDTELLIDSSIEADLDDFIIVDNEIMFISSIVDNKIIVIRGCLDTLPEPHKKDCVVFFCENSLNISENDYSMNEDIYCKFMPLSDSDTLNNNEIITQHINMKGRARKPYPPANVKINQIYYPEMLFGSSLTVTWSHRNKKTQNKKLGFFMGNVQPENGTKYQITIHLNEKMLVDEVVTNTIKTFSLPSLAVGTLHIKIVTILHNEVSIPYQHSVDLQSLIVFKFNNTPFNPNNPIFLFE
ncbi:hypothetical protein J3U11_06820 [Gilliamella sp. B2840]|uniref:phage tail protein n=1 Tax=unclassified Gilliamella TaxID=2685620 RepID=UPI002269E4D6|nr:MULTISPECIES: phage tail protein [unclassified Gilliamella]MCX8665104.1 hypothetical protein [Gilliamella sp. B2887]MCX8700779.1 hypothetical protein [Gilliamella sp. B2840]